MNFAEIRKAYIEATKDNIKCLPDIEDAIKNSLPCPAWVPHEIYNAFVYGYLAGRKKEEECESSPQKLLTSPAIKKWLSTLPKKD